MSSRQGDHSLLINSTATALQNLIENMRAAAAKMAVGFCCSYKRVQRLTVGQGKVNEFMFNIQPMIHWRSNVTALQYVLQNRRPVCNITVESRTKLREITSALLQ